SGQTYALRGGLQPREPQSDLPFGRFRGVRAVNEVLLHLQTPVAAEVTADGPGSGTRGGGGTRDGAEPFDHPVSAHDRGDDGPGEHELNERAIEGLALVFGVVLGEEFGGGRAQFERIQGVSLGFDAGEDLAHEVALDAVGFDENEGS